MAIRHFLALDIPETAVPTVLRVVDSSVYGSGLPAECPRLDIYLPGFTTPVYLQVLSNGTAIQPNFALNLSAKDLQLQHPDEDKLLSLPDGLYRIRYSVSPNDKVFVEYYHLRTTQITAEYQKELCRVQLAECEPDHETHQKLHDLRYLKLYIDAAKATAEQCHTPQKAVAMLEYAKKLLRKYRSGGCLTCTKC